METTAEKIARLRREIAERQAELQHLILGNPRVTVFGSCCGGPIHLYETEDTISKA